MGNYHPLSIRCIVLQVVNGDDDDNDDDDDDDDDDNDDNDVGKMMPEVYCYQQSLGRNPKYFHLNGEMSFPVEFCGSYHCSQGR